MGYWDGEDENAIKAGEGRGARMKLLHVSDLHIGKRINGMALVEDQRHILGQIVSIAEDEDVDALLIAGDIYDKASPSAEAVTVLDSFLTDLAARGIRVLAVPGNHDSAERIAYVQGLLEGQGVCFPRVYDGKAGNVVLEDAHGQVIVWLLPFLKPADVRRFHPDESIGDDYSKALATVIGGCPIDSALRNVAVSHQLVTAGSWSPDRADDEIKLGGIDNVDVSIYDAFDYVALGHVHRPQRVGRDTVRYSGSPLKYSFSEARYDKSAVLVELGSKKEGDETGACVSTRLIPLVPLHDMREVRATLADLLAGDLPNGGSAEDYLHVTLTDEHPQLDAMAKIHEVFPNAMTLDYESAAMVAAREQIRVAVDPDEIDMVELFARFYEEQAGSPMDDMQESIVSRIARKVEEEYARGGDGEEGGAQ